MFSRSLSTPNEQQAIVITGAEDIRNVVWPSACFAHPHPSSNSNLSHNADQSLTTTVHEDVHGRIRAMLHQMELRNVVDSLIDIATAPPKHVLQSLLVPCTPQVPCVTPSVAEHETGKTLPLGIH